MIFSAPGILLISYLKRGSISDDLITVSCFPVLDCVFSINLTLTVRIDFGSWKIVKGNMYLIIVANAVSSDLSS